jgi:hypothetical protein
MAYNGILVQLPVHDLRRPNAQLRGHGRHKGEERGSSTRIRKLPYKSPTAHRTIRVPASGSTTLNGCELRVTPTS